MPARFIRLCSLFVLLVACTFVLHAQNSAGLTGVVADTSGAVVRGATVTLTNPATGTTATEKTDSKGSYRFPIVIPASEYVLTVQQAGFSVFTATHITLQVGITHTENATLKAGETSTVVVNESASELTLNTTDFSIGNNFDVNELNELPIQNRISPAVLFTLQPGVTAGGSVTGARTDQSQITLDGMDVNDFTTSTFGASTVALPVDAIQEFRATVAGQPAANATGGGGIFQLVTKSGTNSFHGNLNEYHRDPSTQAYTWFSKNVTPGTPVIKAKTVQNQFGGNFGGPVLIPKLYNGHDRAFFFVDYDNDRIATTGQGSRIVPLDTFRAGIVSYDNNSSTACASTTATIYYNPNCVSQYTPAQVAMLDPKMVGQDNALLAFVNQRYPHVNNISLGDGVNTGGYTFQQKYLNNIYNYVGRLDYNLTSKQHVFVRGIYYKTDSVYQQNDFDFDPLTSPNQTRSYGYVASHVWEIGANKVNQFYYGDTINVLNNPILYYATGTTSFSTFGPLSGPAIAPASQFRRVPIPEVRDDFNWTIGGHTLGFGGTFKFVKSHTNVINDYNFVNVGLGGLTTALNPTLRPTNINTNATIDARWDSAFTFDLGHIASQSRNYNYNAAGTPLGLGTGSQHQYRSYQSEFYAGDTWRATKSLTLNYGLRYSLYSTPYEVNGNQANPNYSFDDYFKARVAASQAGAKGSTAVPFISYSLGGQANGGAPSFNMSLKDLAPRFGFIYNPRSNPNTVFNGGFALTFDRTVYNAISFYEDQFSYFFSNNVAVNYGNANPNTALVNDPRVGANLAIPASPPGATLSRSTPYLPGVTAGVPTGINSSLINYAIDKNFKSPYYLTFNTGVQQKLQGNMILSINYAGRLGRRLLTQADASQVIDFQDPASGQYMSQAFAGVAQDLRNGVTPANVTRQPWFENQVTNSFANKTYLVAYNQTAHMTVDDISDTLAYLQQTGLIQKNVGLPSQFLTNLYVTNKGWSAYNGLLVNLTKNYSNGLQFRFNYTWAHSTDNDSGVTASIGVNTQGTGMICDALVRRACYGESDFDIKHTITSDFVYALPFGRGKMFGTNMNRILDAAIGGWSASGIPGWRTGNAYTTTSGAFIAGDYNNAPAIFIGNKGQLHHNFHKKANGTAAGIPVLYDDAIANNVNSTTQPGPNPTGVFRDPLGLEYGSRNNLRGPNAFTFDAGLAKSFQIVPDRVKFQFRGDAMNVLNHTVFASPAQNSVNASNFGQITSSGASRLLQVSGRLEF